MIPAPHGGRLVSALLDRQSADRIRSGLNEFPKLWPEEGQLWDAVMIGTGAYSPLEGFMGREALDGVLRGSRLPNTLPWTIPILLTPPGNKDRRTIEALRVGEEVALLDSRDRPIATLRLDEKYPLERTRIAREVYRTTDPQHPNVAELRRTGETVLAGRIRLIDHPASPAEGYDFSPSESRALFARRHWSTVAGFQTRNVPHRGHEHLQRLTLEREEVDGLFIQPTLGPTKPGDYRPGVVLAAYTALIENYLPVDRVVLGALPIAMRFAGPRAALFLAIIRKNFGCSHYIVGRDQAGVGGFYDAYDSHRIFDEFPVGVVPLRFQEAFYCRTCGGMASVRTCPHPESAHTESSQTRIRTAILGGQPLPTEILRPEVAAILRGGSSLLVGRGASAPPDWSGPSPPPLPLAAAPDPTERREDASDGLGEPRVTGRVSHA